MVENQHLSNIRFTELGLHELLMQGLAAAGFEYCTPIQAETLPIALAGQDVAGQAQTGTGKTAAFMLAVMQRLLNQPVPSKRQATQPRAIILAPTRELAIQIHKDAQLLGQFTGLTMALIYGGMDYNKQRASLEQGVDIVIGTPGRIIDYFKQRVLDLRAIQAVVLDEADRMFDLGFIDDIRYLLRRMPKPERRLNMLFSATFSWRVHELAYEHMNAPKIIEIAPDKVTADRVTQKLYHVETENKIPLLLGILHQMSATRTLIFTNTKHAAEKIAKALASNGYQAGVLSGDVPQRKRQSLMARFAKGELPILVATDVAARGLHVPDISHVINYDLPQNAEDYVHRIGRTARAGASGDAISLACEQYVYSLMDIEEYIGHKIPTAPITEELLIAPKPPEKPAKRTEKLKPESVTDSSTVSKRRRRPRRRSKKSQVVVVSAD